MTNDTDTQDTNVVNIQDFRARRQPAQTTENPAYLAARDRETPGTVVPFNDEQAARVLERLLQDWRVARLDEFSQLHGDRTTKLVARIIDIYSN
ncbi:MAG: hypothetical protein KJ955_02765, partial [Nanoarchaeota archaeon]|nr:hypothetical protein [Nanoarchaeota archaeon]